MVISWIVIHFNKIHLHFKESFQFANVFAKSSSHKTIHTSIQDREFRICVMIVRKNCMR